ncbi:hypothetical protein SGLAM104S_09229 [Streptomyces glaucescens]
MDRARLIRFRPFALLAAAALTLSGVTALSPAARAAGADLLGNGGFESGLDGWTCTAGTTVGSPVRSGTSALRATPAGADHARCAQTVTVQPDSQYTLTGHVRGSYVYLGASGTGTTDVSAWTQSATDWQRLTTTFRTGPSTTRVTVYTHGWYGTGAYHADDLSLTGPGTGPAQPPAAPAGLAAGTVTSTSVALSWTAVPGATGYAVYRDGAKVRTVTGTTATVPIGEEIRSRRPPVVCARARPGRSWGGPGLASPTVPCGRGVSLICLEPTTGPAHRTAGTASCQSTPHTFFTRFRRLHQTRDGPAQMRANACSMMSRPSFSRSSPITSGGRKRSTLP